MGFKVTVDRYGGVRGRTPDPPFRFRTRLSSEYQVPHAIAEITEFYIFGRSPVLL